MRRIPLGTIIASAVAVSAALCAIAFLYRKTASSDSPAIRHYAQRIAALQDLDESVDKDTLSIRQGYLRHYDTLNANMVSIQAGIAALERIPAQVDGDTRTALASLLGSFREASQEKRGAIERFASDRAILANSLHYLPLLVESLASARTAGAEGMAAKLRSALQIILVYNLHGTAADAEAAKALVGELRAGDATVEESHDSMRIALDHADLILEYKPRVDADTERILRSPASDLLDGMAGEFSRWSRVASTSGNIYRITLITVCALLAGGLAYFIIRLRLALASLRNANEGLEQRVAERTQALSLANGELHGQMEERQRATAELVATHARVQQILTIMPSVLIGTDGDQRIVLWNARAEEQFAIPAAQALGRPLRECGITWDFAALRERLSTISEVPVHLAEFPYTQPTGQPGLLAVSASQLPSGSGPGLLIAASDITTHKVMEGQLMQSQKLESIGQLAAGVAHEINTPVQFVGDNLRFLQTCCRDLAPVLAGSQALVDHLHDPGAPLADALRKALADADAGFLATEMPKAIEQAQEGVDRVATIVRALKEFSHPDSTEYAAVDLRRSIESTLNVARSEYKYVADVATAFAADLPLVPCLQGEINQVILNLVVNAAHAIRDVVKDSGARGVITVSTRHDGAMAEIRIADTGTGIPEHARPRIFDPFFTTKGVGKGTGQGLYLAHAIIVIKHRGTITFETELGRGTTFIIRLPLDNRMAA